MYYGTKNLLFARAVTRVGQGVQPHVPFRNFITLN